MIDSAKYSVVMSGKIKAGYEPLSVTEAFASLFKLPPEKASAVVGTRFVIKKEVELKVAKTYEDKLSSIGLDIELKKHSGVDALTLEPVVGDSEQQARAETPSTGPALTNGMVCPKCNLEQPKAEQCSGCGVFVHKVMQQEIPQTQSIPAPVQTSTLTQKEESPVDDDPPGALKMMIMPAIAAVLGALLWYLIAISFEYEYGFVAWFIGGAIGYAAVMSGARGDAAGIACAVLVIISILGGKYMATSSFQSDFVETLSSATEYEGVELRQIYEEELRDASNFASLPGDEASLRQFMVSYQYSDYLDPSEVTNEEIAGFKEYSQPRLEEITAYRPSFEEWQQKSLLSSIENLSTLDLMIDGLGWIDILFLFLGIGTAYRLASDGS